MSTGRRRLTPEDRRALILGAAAELFAAQPYDSVSVEDVAAAAGCSRALLYHYYPNKHALFLGVVDHGLGSLLRRTQPDGSLVGVDALHASVHSYFSWAAENSAVYRAMYKVASADADVAKVLAAARARQAARILTGLTRAGVPSEVAEAPITRLLVKSWGTFVTSLCLSWLEDDEATTVEELTRISVKALTGFLRSGLAASR